MCLSRTTFSINLASISNCTPSFWHLRLGHPNPQALKHVLHNCNVPFGDKDVDVFYAACCMGKTRRLHSPSSHTTYASPLELVYSDLYGPSPYAFTLGFKYYMSFVNDFSKFTWIYLLKKQV